MTRRADKACIDRKENADVVDGDAEALRENRRVTVAGGSFGETFEPFAVHVYRLRHTP